MEFAIGLMGVVLIDLVLAGDNAVVIAMAARALPAKQQRLALVFGAMGAIVARVLATLLVAWLLLLPGLRGLGGLALLWIAYTLARDPEEGEDKKGLVPGSLHRAVFTIIAADFIMSLDNMLGVAAVAHGSQLLVALGLLISIPIIVLASAGLLKIMDRFPWLVYVGSAVLAWVAAQMILEEPMLAEFFRYNPISSLETCALITLTLVSLTFLLNRRKHGADDGG
jgi:YjbE family integral membrane protein